MKCAVIYSGGKDGHLALLYALEKGYKINCLINIDGGKNHLVYFNDSRKTEIIKTQGKLMNIPVFVYKTPPGFTPKNVRENFSEIVRLASQKYEFSTVVDSNVKENLEEINLIQSLSCKIKKSVEIPLAKKNIFQIIKECEKRKVESIITALEKNVNPKHLGKKLNSKFVDFIKKEAKKKNKIIGDDFQTLVIGSPLFKKKIKIIDAKILDSIDTTFLKIKKFKII